MSLTLLNIETSHAPVIEAPSRPRRLFLRPNAALPEMDDLSTDIMTCESCRL